jgi:hypothetical protein
MLEDKIEEYDNLMRAGYDEIATNDTEIAEEYFSDAAYVLNEIRKISLSMYNQLQTKYTINPLDFAE